MAEHQVDLQDVRERLLRYGYGESTMPGITPGYIIPRFCDNDSNPHLFPVLRKLARLNHVPVPEVVSYKGSSSLPMVELMDVKKIRVVAIEDRVFHLLNDKEMYAVLAHEFSHIKTHKRDSNVTMAEINSNLSGLAAFGITAGFLFTQDMAEAIKRRQSQSQKPGPHTRRTFIKLGAAAAVGVALKYKGLDAMYLGVESDADAGAIAQGAEKEALISALTKITNDGIHKARDMGLSVDEEFAQSMLAERCKRIRHLPEKAHGSIPRG
jgi:Zn-dependent protease with chaperone function